MESDERREPQGTSDDLEQGTPQEELAGDEPDLGPSEETGADSPADAEREGG